MLKLKPVSRSTLFIFAIAAAIATLSLLLTMIVYGTEAGLWSGGYPAGTKEAGLPRFGSDAELIGAFRNGTHAQYLSYPGATLGSVAGIPFPSPIGLPVPVPTAAPTAAPLPGDYSTTNVQVAGVDEADLVKTDGTYIYLIGGGKLSIVRAYPVADARLVYTQAFENFSPVEMFVSGDRLLVFGFSCPWAGSTSPARPYGYGISVASARLYDIADRSQPRLMKTTEIEGCYVTARMIGDEAYFLVNTYPNVYLSGDLKAVDIIPLYRDGPGDYRQVENATGIYYITPGRAQSFVTICSMSMDNGDVQKVTIAGSGEEVYASADSLYFTYVNWSDGYYIQGGNETTTIVKLRLDRGAVTHAGTGSVSGHPLNQFSMDEYAGYFRIATTKGNVWSTATPSSSNVYVLDEDMATVGSLEGLAPGEQIYSARFAGSKVYLVTFKKVDPLFVIDLSGPSNPKVLGKLKIPGYSDYLHPYDETHLLGIGKDAVDAGEGEISASGLDFALYQGVKMALFDVSDVEHPKELFKTTIGDRGSNTPVSTDHRAFLFDRERGLLVLPVTVAEIKEQGAGASQYGEYVFQGVYVYDVSLRKGFVLRGNVTHYDSDEVFLKSGYYFYGDRSITRSLYIRNVLYTLSNSRLQLNDMNTLEKLKAIDL